MNTTATAARWIARAILAALAASAFWMLATAAITLTAIVG